MYVVTFVETDVTLVPILHRKVRPSGRRRQLVAFVQGSYLFCHERHGSLPCSTSIHGRIDEVHGVRILVFITSHELERVGHGNGGVVYTRFSDFFFDTYAGIFFGVHLYRNWP